MDDRRLADALPRPVGLVFSGGAGLGAIQVGMLQALGEAGVEADLAAGTSVGSLNAAVLAETGSIPTAASQLEETWQRVRRDEVFPGNLLAQAVHVLREGYLHPRDGLRALIERSLGTRRFDELELPLTVVAAETLTGHVHRFRDGDLVTTLLAATALPGLFEPVEIDGVPYWDGGSVAQVPLRAALEAGARSLVVLDAGDVCHLETVPRGVPDGMLLAVQTALRQRVLVEAPIVAEQVPLVYLPRPCVGDRSPLDLDSSGDLIEPSARIAGQFLAEAPVPEAGRMSGEPHTHEGDQAVGATR